MLTAAMIASQHAQLAPSAVASANGLAVVGGQHAAALLLTVVELVLYGEAADAPLPATTVALMVSVLADQLWVSLLLACVTAAAAPLLVVRAD